jgi:uncharacterized protein YcaQ
VHRSGFAKLSGMRWHLMRDITPLEIAAWRDRALADGLLAEVVVEGLGRRYMLGDEVPALGRLLRGRLPPGWRALEASTEEETTFLSPLEPVIHDRDRTRSVFDFDYQWEVYTPAHRRAYGYYALPILWGDRLVGRTDLRLDRATSTLVVSGLWVEDGASERDDRFRAALAEGMRRFLRFVGANTLSAPGIPLLS